LAAYIRDQVSHRQPFIVLLLSPKIAGDAMSLSSLSVICNALRVRKVKL
jgi:cation transport ATPase